MLAYLSVEVEGQEGVDDLDGVLLEDDVTEEVLGVRGAVGLLLAHQLAVVGRQREDLVLRVLDTCTHKRTVNYCGRQDKKGSASPRASDEAVCSTYPAP